MLDEAWTRDLGLRHGKQAEGIAGAQIRLGSKVEFGEVGKLAEIVRMYARRIKLGARGGHMGVNGMQGGCQTPGLQRCYFVPRGKFNRVKQLAVGGISQSYSHGETLATSSPLMARD